MLVSSTTVCQIGGPYRMKGLVLTRIKGNKLSKMRGCQFDILEQKNMEEPSKPMTKKEAIESCHEPHLLLLKCFQDPDPLVCINESNAFYECYRKARGQTEIGYNFTGLVDNLKEKYFK